MAEKAERAEVERDQPRREPETPAKREERSQEPETLAAAAPDAGALAAVMRAADSGSRALAATALQRQLGNAQLQRLAKAPRVQIQRFEGWEHAYLGDKGDTGKRMELKSHKTDLPNHGDANPESPTPPATWPEKWQTLWKTATAAQKYAIVEGLSYGDVVALSGDFYRSWDELNNAPLFEVINLVGGARNKDASFEQLQAQSGGRFMDMAEHNVAHFSPKPTTPGEKNNIDTWKDQHAAAINAARAGNADAARGMNAAADHFLTDAFSGGHIGVDRDELMKHWYGQPASRAEHNWGNEYGVHVKNKRGNKWTAYGDSNLGEETYEQGAKDKDTKNIEYALEAVEASRQEVEAAKSRTEDATPSDDFKALEIVPEIDPDPGLLTEIGDAAAAPVRAQVLAVELVGELGKLYSFADDTQIREYVKGLADEPAALGRLPVHDKIHMVTRLLEGWISDDDVDAAVAILEAPATPADRDTMRDALISPVAKMRTARQKARVEAALASTNAPPEPVKEETPVRQGRPVESAPEPAPGGGFDESGFQHSFAPKYRGERHALKGRIFQAIRAAGKTTFTPSDDDVRLGHGPAESMWWDCLTDSGGESKFDPVAGIDIIPKKDSVTLEEAETEVAELAGLPADKRCPFFDELYGAERAKAAGSSK